MNITTFIIERLKSALWSATTAILSPFVSNVRRGFATNSSSSHSCVYMKEPQSQVDELIDENEFSWRDFSLRTIKEKVFYYLVDNAERYWDSPEAAARDFPELSQREIEFAMEGNVDHQSSREISLEQARDPRTVIFGGNDNDDESEELMAAVDAGEVDFSKPLPYSLKGYPGVPDAADFAY